MTAARASAFQTDWLAPSARALALREAIEGAFPPMRVLDVDDDARASLYCTPLAAGAIFRLETSRKRVRWSPVKSGPASLHVLLAVRGECQMLHAGQAALLGPGTFAFVDDTHPFELSVSDDWQNVLFEVPRDVARARLALRDDALGRSSSIVEGGDRHVARTLRSLAQTASTMSSAERAVSEHALMNLLSMASVLRVWAPEGSRWLARAHALLDAHAFERDFDAAALAAALGVSRRYLDRLFADSGTTVSHELWGRRLRRAAQDLHSPHEAHRTILDIALCAGFADAAHFARAFRRRFACTPSAWRKRRATGQRVGL